MQDGEETMRIVGCWGGGLAVARRDRCLLNVQDANKDDTAKIYDDVKVPDSARPTGAARCPTAYRSCLMDCSFAQLTHPPPSRQHPRRCRPLLHRLHPHHQRVGQLQPLHLATAQADHSQTSPTCSTRHPRCVKVVCCGASLHPAQTAAVSV